MPKDYLIGDQTKTLYSIGELAEEIDRTAQTLRLWERKGIFPKTPYTTGKLAFSKRNKRLYTAEHKEELNKLSKKYNLRSGIKFPDGFARELKKAFNSIATIQAYETV